MDIWPDMKFYFIVKDAKGPKFIKELFQKKRKENMFSGILKDARRVPILSEKLRRVVSAAVSEVDRIIILADADGGSLTERENRIYRYIDNSCKKHVCVVLLDYEIEEWICYSHGFVIDDKPSEVLKKKLSNGYEKNQLPSYASKLDCKKLEKYDSFGRLLDALNSD